jgi:hypothetical protein
LKTALLCNVHFNKGCFKLICLRKHVVGQGTCGLRVLRVPMLAAPTAQKSCQTVAEMISSVLQAHVNIAHKFCSFCAQAQADAINLLAGQKTNENPENVVGVLTLAGKGPRVLVTPTGDLGKILGAMHGLGMDGETNLCSGVQVCLPYFLCTICVCCILYLPLLRELSTTYINPRVSCSEEGICIEWVTRC